MWLLEGTLCARDDHAQREKITDFGRGLFRVRALRYFGSAL